MIPYRPGLPERPPRMRSLPLNDKGYPVPWFVDWVDGVPEFRAMDPVKWERAVHHKLCWLCGERLGHFFTFVAGPMCGINRTSSEPPSHHDCAVYAARACPFLTLPKAVRRQAGLPEGVQLQPGQKQTENNIVGGISLTRNPGVAMLWTTTRYTLHKVDNGYLLEMGPPTEVEWFCEGRRATRAEVDESIRTGMPFLQKIADDEGGGAPAQLASYVQRMQAVLPAE